MTSKPQIIVLRPVPRYYVISAPFGHNTGPHKGKPHKGTDFACPEGTPVLACADGQVVKVADKDQPDDPTKPEAGPSKAGNRIWLWVEGNKYTARFGYYHLKTFSVKQGQKVKEGDILGLSGNTGNSTGPHLHFECRVYPGDVPSPIDFYSAETDPKLWGRI